MQNKSCQKGGGEVAGKQSCFVLRGKMSGREDTG